MRQVGNYRIVEQIGAGGMGAVFRGEHAMLGKPVAIKILLPELSHSQEMVTRFFNEARATAQLQHPGIIDVFDFGYCDDDRSAYIVMELLTGQSLRQRLAVLGRMPWQGAVYSARQIARALAAAHRGGIVHRDLKPDNVFLIQDRETGYERVKVLDFGIAKLTEHGNAPAPGSQASIQTRAGMLMGTPAYMSPQQCRGAAEVDHRADIYSLGCMLFEMLCGRPPFVGEGIGDLITAHIAVAPPSTSQFVDTVPAKLEALVQRALAKSEQQRQQTMDEVVAALDELGVPGAPSMSGSFAEARPTTPPSSAVVTAQVPTGTAPSATTLGATTGQLGSAPAAKSGAGKWVIAVAGGVAALAVVAVVLGASGGHGDDKKTPAKVATTTTTKPPPGPAPKRKAKLSVTQLTDEQVADKPVAPVAPGSAAPVVDKAAAEKASLSTLLDMTSDSALLLWTLGGDDYLIKNLGPNATVRIESRPSGAAVTYDGVTIGNTPLSFQLERGAYAVDVELAMPERADRTVVDLGRHRPHRGRRHAGAGPRRGAVQADRRGGVRRRRRCRQDARSSSSCSPSDQPQPITLKLDKYVDKPFDLAIKAGKTIVTLDPVPQPVAHELDSIPPNVDVVYNGAVVGKTPYKIEFLEERGKFRDYVLKAPPNQARYKDTFVHIPADKPFKRQIKLDDI